jgi:transposase
LKAWLLEHQQIEVIARDRSGEYASEATAGAPQAIQVADRFHLLQNLKQMLDRLLTMMYRQIRPLLIVEENNGQQVCMPTRLLSSIRDSSAHEQAASTASRERRLETYQQIKQLKSAGWKIGQISRRLDINPTTVRKHFYAETFPERASRPARGSILDPYLKHLESRYREGCQNALQLWREIKEKGYQGTRRQVSKWMSKRREQDQTVVCSTEGPTVDNSSSSPPPRPLSNALPSPRQLAWLMMRQSEQLNQEENKILARIQENTQVKQIHTLSQEFIGMVKKRDVAQLDQWIQNCKDSGIAMLQSFATRIKQDYAAVRAALETKWSNGQTEGQVNRLKLLKRQMYGRANFDLLRLRVLYPT